MADGSTDDEASDVGGGASTRSEPLEAVDASLSEGSEAGGVAPEVGTTANSKGEVVCRLREIILSKGQSGAKMLSTALFVELYKTFPGAKAVMGSKPKAFVNSVGQGRLQWMDNCAGGTCEVAAITDGHETTAAGAQAAGAQSTKKELKATKKAAKAAKKTTAGATAKVKATSKAKATVAQPPHPPRQAALEEDIRGPERTLREQNEADDCAHDELAQGAEEVEHSCCPDSAEDSALEKRVASYFMPPRCAGGTGTAATGQRRATLYTAPSGAPPGMELGLLGHVNTQHHADAPPPAAPEDIFLNVSDPFCFVTVGVQGAGKSHTTNCVLEACLLPYPHVSQVRQPMAALVCHYDQSETNCCEATGLAEPSKAMEEFLRGHESGGDSCEEGTDNCDDEGGAQPSRPPPAPYLATCCADFEDDKLVVLCSPSNFHNRRKFYEGTCTVRPLLFRWSRLNASQIKMLMRLDDSSTQLYVAAMLDKLRGYQRRGKLPDFEGFVDEFKQACSGTQSAPLEQRFRLLSSMVYESKENQQLREERHLPSNVEECDLADVMKAGRMVVADLTDPMMAPAEANGVFQVLLATFRNKQVGGAGKLVAFDEAHRYMGLNGESDALAREITDCARLMRHEGLRLLISTQSPKAMPEELLELTTVLVAHRFQSGDWHAYLSKKVPLPEGSFEEIRALAPGEALVYSARPCLGPAAGGGGGGGDDAEDAMRVQVRKRLTADRGASRMNRRVI
jgi:hypothetical protein